MSQSTTENCCIFHPRLRALQTYRVRDTVLKEWFQYGLCPICSNRLKKQPSFKQNISDRIEEVLNDMIKKHEEKKNAKTNNR